MTECGRIFILLLSDIRIMEDGVEEGCLSMPRADVSH